MSSFRSPRFLRGALLTDAIASGAGALLMLAGAGLLAAPLGLPAALLREAGLILVPFVAFVAWLGTREHLGGAAVWSVIGLNALWVVGSGVLLTGGWVAPTLLGHAFVIAQAVVVAVFAELQFMGLQRASRALA